MAKKIAVTLRKGGSGKTTTAINLASALYKKGKQTLLVDVDPQANATISVGIDPEILKKHINILFTKIDTEPSDVLVKTNFGLDVLPSHPDLAETEAGMSATQVGTLKAILAPLEERYEYIVVDTPPAESYLTVSALVSVDEVIIPLQAHYLAMRGLREIVDEINKVKKGLNPDLFIRGILPTMVSQRTNLAKTVLKAVRETYGSLLLPFQVNFSIKHTEANLAGLPIILYDPKHKGSKAYEQLANYIIGDAQ